MCHVLNRTLTRDQNVLLVELGEDSQRTVGQHHLVWRHLSSAAGEVRAKQQHRAP